MPNIFKTSAVVVFLALSAGLQALAREHAAINIRQGMHYDQARAVLIKDGWQTVQKRWQDRSCPDGIDRCKWPETEACAPTGTGPCIAYFQDIYGNVLKVHSNGSGGKNGISNFYLTQ